MSFAVLCMLSTAAVAEGPKAGGVPGAGGPALAVGAAALGCSGSGGAWQPTAAAARPSEPCLRKVRRDLSRSSIDIASGL